MDRVTGGLAAGPGRACRARPPRARPLEEPRQGGTQRLGPRGPQGWTVAVPGGLELGSEIDAEGTRKPAASQPGLRNSGRIGTIAHPPRARGYVEPVVEVGEFPDPLLRPSPGEDAAPSSTPSPPQCCPASAWLPSCVPLVRWTSAFTLPRRLGRLRLRRNRS